VTRKNWRGRAHACAICRSSLARARLNCTSAHSCCLGLFEKRGSPLAARPTHAYTMTKQLRLAVVDALRLMPS
jgi:hypothetical protein